MDDETTIIEVEVDHIRIPSMSTIGYGMGTDLASGNRVTFAGDHRPMRDLGEAISEGERIIVTLEGWEILEVQHGTP